ncbi:MAG: VWA domain-containing protein [Thermoanaerobaculia bacterium]|nr:VWA domain-containing protein [Thermoanaerobaculia bacterium]
MKTPTCPFVPWGMGLVLVLAAAATAAEPPAPLVLLFDGSGSMWSRAGGEEKIAVARRVVGGLVAELAADQPLGLVAYGHRRDGDCRDVETLLPLGTHEPAAVQRLLNQLQPKGKTPISAGVEAALALVGQGPATLVLVTDGLETCGGDPCATVRAARERGIDLVFHVVGFDVAKEDVTQLECAAQAGRGLYLPASGAAELKAALATATALPAAEEAAVLSVHTHSDRGLEDALVVVRRPGQKSPVTQTRTYRDVATNPRRLPLPAGSYEVEVRPLGLAGETARTFPISLGVGETVERSFDFSTGELVLAVTRNGAASDATYEVLRPGESKAVVTGRTYADSKSAAARVRLSAGTYEVKIQSVEIAGRPTVTLGTALVMPGGTVQLSHDLPSGNLTVGVQRGARLVDAVVAIRNDAGTVDQGRTYQAASSNPKTFVVSPGRYRVEIAEIQGAKRTLEVTVAAGETATRIVDLDAPP